MGIREVKHKKSIFAILALLILASVGATIAYLQDRASFENEFYALNDVKIFEEGFVPPVGWKPCDVTPKEATVTNERGQTVRVRMSYEEYWKAADGVTDLGLTFVDETDGTTQNYAIIHFKNLADWIYNSDDGYYYYKDTLAPGETTSSFFESVELNCNSNFSGTITTCEETPTGKICSKVPNDYETATYHLSIHFEAAPEFPTVYTVSIDPNGGTFNGSSNVYSERVEAGTVVDLSSISRPLYSLTDWTKDGSESYTGSSIMINASTTLVANWTSVTRYNITVNPNGGSYRGDTNPTTYEVGDGDTFTLDTPTRAGYVLAYWEINGGPLSGNSFTVTGDETVAAVWEQEVARNERTNKVYGSISAAHAEAESGDTITLLVDTAEDFTNTKTITLDLGTHTVTGSLTNSASGNIILLNGEINNQNGAAVTNYGTMVMGVNDYGTDGVASINPNYVRLIGTTVGLIQEGILDFYDGYIEGDLGIDGGHRNAPSYRRASDDVMIYYYPVVDHIGSTTRQHVELAVMDRAVSKTTVGGDVFYYDLQDNINASAITGYDIYAVRDFPATYPLNVPAGSTINFDIKGYQVGFQETATINGTLNITDSSTTEANPSGTTSMNYVGAIVAQQTIVNNGTLNLTDVKVTGATTNDTITNKSTVNMTRSNMTQSNGYVTRLNGNQTWNMDNLSSISSTSGSYAAVLVTAPSEWTSGQIISNWRAVQNDSTFTVSGGKISSKITGIDGGTNIIEGNGVVEVINPNDNNITIEGISGGTLTVRGNGRLVIDVVSNWSAHGYSANSGSANVSGNGLVQVTNNGTGATYGIYAPTLTMTGGEIRVGTSYRYATAYGHYAPGYSMRADMAGGTINVTSNNNAYGIYGSAGSSTAIIDNDASINVSGVYGQVIGLRAGYGENYYNSNFQIKGGTITAHSDESTAYGVEDQSWGSASMTRVTGGEITASSNNGTSAGIYARYSTTTGGEVSGGTYGIYNIGNATIGTNGDSLSITVPEITGGSYGVYGGNVYFYDGILKGDVDSYQSDIIKAIPDGTILHEEIIDGTENCWLVPSANYLRVGNTDYNSLTKAYDAVADGGTVLVIDDATVGTALPTNPSGKTIYFDLNGHTLTYTQSLPNSGTMYITDSSRDKDGVLNNVTNPTITNGGTLYITAGTITNPSRAITNNGTTTISGGRIESKYIGIYGGTAIVEGDAVIEIAGNSNNGAYGIYNSTTTLRGNGQITVTNNSSSNAQIVGVYSQNMTMQGGRIDVTNVYGDARGIYAGSNCTYAISGGVVNVTSTTYGVAEGINAYGADVTMTGGEIIATNTGSGGSWGMHGWGSTTVSMSNDARMTVSSVANNAIGIEPGYGESYYAARITISDNSVISAHSDNATAFGVYDHGWANYSMTTVSGGTVTASSDNGSSTGIYTYKGTFTGGEITGGTYGVRTVNTSTIGANDGTININAPIITGGINGIYGGNVSFYDGTLRGGTNAYQDGIIKAIPDGTTYHIETISGLENCWLVAAANYLRVNGVDYNSLTEAYNNVADGGTVQVIADATIITNLPTNPSGKTIYFDLNGFNLTYTQSLPNAGTMHIIDGSTNHDGVLYDGTNATISNSGTLYVEAGTVEGASLAISNSGTATISGGEVTSPVTAINGGTVIVEGNGIVRAAGNAAEVTAIKSVSSATLRGNGQVIASGDSTSQNVVYAFQGSDFSVTIQGGLASVSNTNGDSYGVNSGSSASLSMSGGRMELNNTSGIAVAVTGSSANLTMTGGEIEVTNIYNAYGVRGYAGTHFSLSGNSRIAVSSTDGEAIGVRTGSGESYYSSDITITSGELTASSVNGSATAVSSVNWGYGRTVAVSGGTITASSDNNTSTAITTYIGNITGGTITGGTYGIVTNERATIGVSDSLMDNTAPVIIGGSYALYNGDIYFYDGKLKGGINAINNIDNVKAIESGATIYVGSETIGADEYEVNYLIAEYDVAQIGSTKYTRLSDAIDAAGVGDTIYLIADNYIFYRLEIPAGKDITIETDGHNIITGNQITNNGNVKIINSNTSSTPTFVFRGSNYYLVNAQNASLEIEKLAIQSANIVSNSSTLQIKDSSLNSTNIAIDSTGNLTLDGATVTSTKNAIQSSGTLVIRNQSSITGSNYAVYVSGGTVDIDDSTITGGTAYYQQDATNVTIDGSDLDGYINVASGDIAITDCNITRSGENLKSFLYNAGTMTIADSQLDYTDIDTVHTFDSNKVEVISNNGSMTIADTDVTMTLTGNAGDIMYSIVNAGTDLAVTNSSIILDASHATGESYNGYGLYNGSGTVALTDATISINRRTTNYGVYNTSGTVEIHRGYITASTGAYSYGIYNDGGTVTLGEPEPSTSPDYGLDTADVSIAIPEISAIGATEGYGVIYNSGRFNFYDGKIIANTQTLNKAPTNAEHVWEPCTFTNTQTTPTTFYTILKWMRNGQSACSN